jgi:nicotinate-nucleotide adenylyltransferase
VRVVGEAGVSNVGMRAGQRGGDVMHRVLLFGGSYDPVHNGHLIVSRHVAERLDVERVVLIPSAAPPHKLAQKLSPAADRLAMCRLAVAGDPQFEVSDWELGQTGPNYTLLTIRHFRTVLGPDAEICWLVGMDSLLELGTWYRAGELVEACTIVTAARPGFVRPEWAKLAGPFTAEQRERLDRHIIPGPEIEIASREIRARARVGQSIRYFVPEAVREYIEQRGLYREV